MRDIERRQLSAVSIAEFNQLTEGVNPIPDQSFGHRRLEPKAVDPMERWSGLATFQLDGRPALPLPACLTSDKDPIVTFYVLFSTVGQPRQLKHATARERCEASALSTRRHELFVKHSRSLQVTL